MLFTRTDKALLQRAARTLTEEAEVLTKFNGPDWNRDATAKAAKRAIDRHLRDARDLRALCKRLEVTDKAGFPVTAP